MIDREHWLLWARWRAEGDLTMNYRATNILYTPPRRLPEDDDDARPMLGMPTDEDYRIVQLLELAVGALAKSSRHEAGALIEWFGAYPGAPDRRGQRVMRMELNPRQARHVVDRLTAWVDGWVDCYERRREVA